MVISGRVLIQSFAVCLVLLCTWPAAGQAGGLTPHGVPSYTPASDGSAQGYTTPWTVWSCPEKGDCDVSVTVTPTPDKPRQGDTYCTFTLPDFIDRHPKNKNQQINLMFAPSTVWTVQFGHAKTGKPGITIVRGSNSVDHKIKDKDKQGLKIRDTAETFILYTVRVEYKRSASTDEFTPCTYKGQSLNGDPEDQDGKGPGIVNRG